MKNTTPSSDYRYYSPISNCYRMILVNGSHSSHYSYPNSLSLF